MLFVFLRLEYHPAAYVCAANSLRGSRTEKDGGGDERASVSIAKTGSGRGRRRAGFVSGGDFLSRVEAWKTQHEELLTSLSRR
jgi:hypothetical protein